MNKKKLMGLVREHTSPFVGRFLRRALGLGIHYRGPYPSWHSASAQEVRATPEDYVRRTEEYTRAFQLRGAPPAYASIQGGKTSAFRFQVQAAVLAAAAHVNRPVHVTDFGGGLGAMYFDCLRLCEASLPVATWSVVETPEMIRLGSSSFQDGRLRFGPTVADCARTNGAPDLIIASGVLHLLEDPWGFIAEFVSAAPLFLLFDRVPVNRAAAQLIALQVVPSAIGGTRSTCWLFSEQRLLEAVKPHYELLTSFDGLDGTIGFGRLTSDFRGYLFRRMR